MLLAGKIARRRQKSPLEPSLWPRQRVTLGSHLPFLAAVDEASWLVKTGDRDRSCAAAWEEQAQAHPDGTPLVGVNGAPAWSGRNLIAIVETDSCFWAQPRQRATWRPVFQKAPPPALFRFPSHSASHHPARGAVFSPMTPCLSSHKTALPRGMWFCWFGSLSSPSTEASAWQLPVIGQCLRKEPVLGEARSWPLSRSSSPLCPPLLEHEEAPA